MYFAKFPTITYPFEINGKLTAKTVTDITINVRIIKEILANLTLYDEYDIKEGDTPEIIAEKVYGSPLYHWVLMITNDRFDYTTDFPLTTYELEQYVLRKYGGPIKLRTTQAVTNSTTVHVESTTGLIVGTSFNYRPTPSASLIVTYITEILNDKSFTVSDTITSLPINTLVNAHPVYGVHHYEDDKGNIINKGNINVYGIASVERIISNYDYEARLNESKRRIKLISPENLFRILAQFKSLV
jgi:hypothetical protein